MKGKRGGVQLGKNVLGVSRGGRSGKKKGLSFSPKTPPTNPSAVPHRRKGWVTGFLRRRLKGGNPKALRPSNAPQG